MIDNFIEDDLLEYQSYNKVYTHDSGHHIYLGDASSANDTQFIKRQCIGLIVTAATNMEHLKYQSNIRHHVYSLLDAKSQNMAVHFTHFYDLVEDYIVKGNVLVHCFAGVSRSATLVISYVMKKNKLNFKDAIAEIRKHRPKVLPNLGFERQLKQYEKMLKIQELSITRKLISKTSESRKHQSKKLPEIGLPQIFALGKTLGRPKIMDPPPLLQPSSQMQSRKMRRQYDQIRLAGNEDNNYAQQKFKFYEPLTNRLPIKSFRKRSISISRKVPKNMVGSDQQVELVRLPPHKLAINDIRFDTQKVIKSTVLKQFYH